MTEFRMNDQRFQQLDNTYSCLFCFVSEMRFLRSGDVLKS